TQHSAQNEQHPNEHHCLHHCTTLILEVYQIMYHFFDGNVVGAAWTGLGFPFMGRTVGKLLPTSVLRVTGFQQVLGSSPQLGCS
ncbi:MAG: hypothetical protein KAY96_05935, partial [Bacteroidia bacterium]|nr:hypothetical protein [Bacteroidia bacterium]